MIDRYRIVVLEDEGLIALDLKERIERAGYDVVEIADTAQGALDAVAAHRPDLVFMDILVRGEHDGVWAADRIRRRFDTPIVFVTALADEATIQRARVAEPYGYLVKPFHNVDFRSQIETVVWKHREDRKRRMNGAWMAAALRHAQDGLIALGPEGDVVLMNTEAERITGFTIEEAAGREITEVLPLADERTGMPLLTPLLAVHDGREPTARTATYVLRGGRGAGALVEVSAAVQRDDVGLIGLILDFRDVTSQRRQADREAVDLRIGSIAPIAEAFGRELNEHLERIAALCHGAANYNGDGHGHGDVRRDIASAHRSATSALNVVRHLRELGNTRRPSLAPASLAALLNEALEKTDGAAGDKWTRAVSLPESLPCVLTHADGCVRHLRHLLREARACMPGGGETRIGARVGGGLADPKLTLTVRAVPRSQTAARLGALATGYRLELVRHFMHLSGGAFECAVSREQDVVFTLSFQVAGFVKSAAAGGPPA